MYASFFSVLISILKYLTKSKVTQHFTHCSSNKKTLERINSYQRVPNLHAFLLKYFQPTLFPDDPTYSKLVIIIALGSIILVWVPQKAEPETNVYKLVVYLGVC